MRRWKLSPMDLQSVAHWEDYSRAKDETFLHTDIPEPPRPPSRGYVRVPRDMQAYVPDRAAELTGPP